MRLLCILRSHRDEYPRQLLDEIGSGTDLEVVAVSDAVYLRDDGRKLIKLKEDLKARGLKETENDIDVAELVDKIFECDKVITF